MASDVVEQELLVVYEQEIANPAFRKKEGDVTPTVIRNKSQQTIRVTSKEGAGFSGTLGEPQVGRRIVIPRVNIPDIDIYLPRIEFPVIPSININLPRVRVSPLPRIRSVRTPI